MPRKPKPQLQADDTTPPPNGTHRGIAHFQKKATDQLARALALSYEKGLTAQEIGRIMGVPRQTIDDWLRPFKSFFLDRKEEIKAFKQQEAGLQDALRWALMQGMLTKVGSMTEEEIKKTDLSRFSWAYGLVYDKNRLQTGQSTENIKSISDLVKEAHAVTVNADVADAEIVPPTDP